MHLKNSKLASIGTSIFAVMSKMAEEFSAINLSQGFPDFNCSEELIELVNKYMLSGKNQYAPMPGVFGLREKIAEKYLTWYNAMYDPGSEILITSGATEALYAVITTVINTGDEAIIFEPAYDSYSPVIRAAGGIPVPISLEGDDFHINWDEVKKRITRKTKLIIINSPHNPTGSIVTEADIKELEKLTDGTEIIVLSDEVYEHIVFDNNKHLSFSSSELLYNRTFIISSFGKSFHTTGWKVGYVCAPEPLMNELKKLHQFIVFAVNTPVQFAYTEYMDKKNVFSDLKEFYQAKRDLFNSTIKGSKFSLIPAQGTYFQLLEYSNISTDTDNCFAEYLTKEKKVAVIPLSPFYEKESERKLIRICFAKKDEVLIKAGEILSGL